MTTVTASTLLGALLASYLVGSIPFAYVIVKLVSGADITTHGTGNVGSMNVRRTTGSWGWFAVAVLADGMKGLIPVAVSRAVLLGPLHLVPWSLSLGRLGAESEPRWWFAMLLPQVVVAGCVLGHNYSVWMALIEKRFTRTGKGLATGAGALLAYDWRYFVTALVVALAVIAITRYMMAGQVAAAVALPIAAVLLHSPDRVFALALGALVYVAHHKRFIGLLRGEEPKLYIYDRMGPKG